MKLIWAQIFTTPKDEAYSLSLSEDLTSFGYWQRSTVREHLKFASRTSSARCHKGARVTITLKEVPFKCHVYRRIDGLTGVVIADNEYPERVAHTLISKFLIDFNKTYHESKWIRLGKDTDQDKSFSAYANTLGQYLVEYQDPKKADKLLHVQQNLDEIKQIMHKNIEEVLRRGEKLDDLLMKSDDIGELSKMFHKKAKKTNQCCQWY